MRRRFINNMYVNSAVDWNYLTIEPLEDGVTVETSIENLSYKINGDITWQNFPTHTVSRELKLGESIAFKGRISDNSDNLMGWGRFIVNGRFKLTGDCMSILYDDAAKQIYYLESKHSYCFAYMFVNNTGLEYCDKNFLKATTLASNCYRGMFQGCNNLKYAPELPTTTLASECYYKMFENCTSLDYIKMLATDISAYGCLTDWVSGVASKGTFVKHPNMTSLPTGVNGIPSGWTVVNDGEESGGDGDKVVNKVQLVNDGL